MLSGWNACGSIGSVRAEYRVHIDAGVSLALSRHLVFASWGCGTVGRPSSCRAGPRSRFALPPHPESGVSGDRGRWPSVDGVDDLAAIDALEVDAGDAEVGVPELALDHYERHAFVRHLDCVSMPQLGAERIAVSLLRRRPRDEVACVRLMLPSGVLRLVR